MQRTLREIPGEFREGGTMSLSDDDKLAIAARYASASRENDADGVRAMSAPGATTWHNFDEIEVTTEQSVRTLAWLHRNVEELAWTDVATLPTPNGFVSQTVMTGTAPGGPLRVHSCLVVTLNGDGLVTRAEEYLDTAQAAALRA